MQPTDVTDRFVFVPLHTHRREIRGLFNTHPKEGLDAGTKAEAEAKKADKQKATFILE